VQGREVFGAPDRLPMARDPVRYVPPLDGGQPQERSEEPATQHFPKGSVRSAARKPLLTRTFPIEGGGPCAKVGG